MLGRGGYGVVTLVSKRTARKTQRPSVRERGVSTAALREIACTVALRDLPGLPHVRRADMADDGTTVIDMRRCDMTLLDLIRERGRIDVDLAKHILYELCAALARAHARGIMHRDVKPENIMISIENDRATVTVIDFGMARFAPTTDRARWTPHLTTAWYRPPEVLLGEPYSFNADAWSVGVVAVELITGKCPFSASGEIALIERYVRVLGAPPRGVFPSTWDAWESTSRHSGVTCASEPSRAAHWTRVLGDPLMGDFVDHLLRWDPSQRWNMRDALLHPIFGGSTDYAHIRAPGTDVPALASARYASTRGMRDAVGLVWKTCAALSLPDGTAWYAALLLARLSGRLPLDATAAIVCVDLANKVIGVQTTNVLRALRVQDARRAEVRIVRDVLRFRLHGFRTPWGVLRQMAHDVGVTTPLPHQPQREWPWWYVHACGMLDALPIRSPECLAWSDVAWEAAAHCALKTALRMCGREEIASTIRARPGISRIVKRIIRAWAPAALRGGKDSSCVTWRRTHRAARRHLRDDPVVAHRAARALRGIAKR